MKRFVIWFIASIWVAAFVVAGWEYAHSEDRYGDGGLNFKWARIGVYRCVDNVKDRIGRGVIHTMTRGQAIDLCIAEYLRQYRESVDVTERLVEGMADAAYPHVSNPTPPKQQERELRKMMVQLRAGLLAGE